MTGARAAAAPCPICARPTLRSAPAAIAPFVRRRCALGEEVMARLHFCDRCEHAFFTPWLDVAQLRALYAGYRDGRYNAERLEVEPSYAPYAEAFADPGSSYHRIRRDFYDFFLGDLRDFAGRVTDFGGGDGGFTGHIFPRAEVVVADEAFERDGGDLEALLAGTDILFAAHILEHLPQPVSALSRLTAALRPGTQVYVELPIEYPGRLGDAFAEVEAHPNQSAGGALQTLHEHIAHFSRRSASILLRRCGLAVGETARGGPDIPLMALWGRKPEARTARR